MKANVMKKVIILAATVLTLGLTAVPAMAATQAPATTLSATKSVALKSISLNKKAMTLNVSKTATLKVTFNPTNTTVRKKVTWKSSNTSIATVTSAGKVTAKKPGTATITATVNGKKATCKVTVKAPITKVSMNKSSVSVDKGKTAVLSASYAPANTTDSKTVTWKSSNTNVATVSNGKVTAKKAGTATITAKIGTKTATCKVTVVEGVTITQPAGSKFVDTAACYTTLNTYRKNAKLANVTKDAKLEAYAKVRATEIINNFSHTRPNGTSGLSVIPGNIHKGENIAMGQKTCADVMSAWYASAGHKANVLGKNFTKVGIAGLQYNGKIYWVQLFSS